MASSINDQSTTTWDIHFTDKGITHTLTLSRDISVAELLQRIALAIKRNVTPSFRVLSGGVLIKATPGMHELALEKYSVLKDGAAVQVMGDETGVPVEIRDLWWEVAQGLTNSGTIVWKKAVESLEAVKQHFSDEQARSFAELHMHDMLAIMTAQDPWKIGLYERTCVKETLQLAAEIVSMNLHIATQGDGGNLLNSLEHMFNPKATYMAATSSDCTVKHIAGWFSEYDGFINLATYMAENTGSPNSFPGPKVVALVVDLLSGPDLQQQELLQNKAATAVIIKASIDHISICDEAYLLKIAENEGTLTGLRRALLQAARSETIATYCDEWQLWDLWSSIVLRMTDTELSPAVRKTGWAAWHDLMQWSVGAIHNNEELIVDGAGLGFVNGLYTATNVLSNDGLVYTRTVPDGFGEASGTTLTCTTCIMRSLRKRWFISRAHEEHPGTDRDIDYYMMKNAGNITPLLNGWEVCREHGVEPAPTLQLSGKLGLPKDQSTPLQFCRWAQENCLFTRAESDCAYSEYIYGTKESGTLLDLLPLLRWGMSDEARSIDLLLDARFEKLYDEMNTCKTETDEALKVMESSNSSAHFETAIMTIEKILENIMTKKDEKYRKVKVKNAKFQLKLAGRQGADQLMRGMGFDRSQGSDGVEYYAYKGSIFGLLAVKTSLDVHTSRVREAAAAAREAAAANAQRLHNMIAVDHREAQMLETAILRSLADAADAQPPGGE